MTRGEHLSLIWVIVGPLILLGWWTGLDTFLLFMLWLAGAVWTFGVFLPKDDDLDVPPKGG